MRYATLIHSNEEYAMDRLLTHTKKRLEASQAHPKRAKQKEDNATQKISIANAFIFHNITIIKSF